MLFWQLLARQSSPRSRLRASCAEEDVLQLRDMGKRWPFRI
jgi:hypothetical protein